MARRQRAFLGVLPRRPHADLLQRGDEALGEAVAQRRAVVVLLGPGVRRAGVEVGVDVDDGQRPVHCAQPPSDGQGDGVVATDEEGAAAGAGQGLYVSRDLRADEVRGEGREDDVAAVDAAQGGEDVEVAGRVPAAHRDAGRAHRPGSEA